MLVCLKYLSSFSLEYVFDALTNGVNGMKGKASVKRLNIKNMEQERKYNKLGEWLHSDAEPMIDLSGMSETDKASLLKMVMR